MDSLPKDIIRYLAKFCDEFTRYFLMQTCKKCASSINFYNVNIFGIYEYSVSVKNRLVYRWFALSKMVVDNNESYIHTLCLAIMNNQTKMFNYLFPIIVEKKLFEISIAITAIEYHKHNVLKRIFAAFGDISYIGFAYNAIRYSNIVAFKMAFSKIKDKLPPNQIKLAAKKGLFDILDIIASRYDIGCICDMSRADLKIAEWCKKSSPTKQHPDIASLYDIVKNGIGVSPYIDALSTITERCDIRRILSKIIIRCNFVNVHLIKQLKLNCFRISYSAAKRNRIDILQYLSDIRRLSATNALDGAIKGGNIETIKWIYNHGGKIDANTKVRALRFGRCDVFYWLFSVDPTHNDEGALYINACIIGDIEVLKYLRQIGCTWYGKYYNILYRHNHWNTYKLAIAEGFEMDDNRQLLYSRVASKFGPQFCKLYQ